MSEKLPSRKLLNWFRRNRRDLPWRDNQTPYSVWVSEVMLQQTVVGAVVSHYQRWMKRFPTIEALAEAEIDDVTRHWEGLGYYSRARNIKKAARRIVDQHSGRLPADYQALTALPGIGDYTASAILSIAFGKPYPALDANVKRILQRVLLLKEWTVDSESAVRAYLAANISRSRPGEFNEALMELGQTICSRRQPSCYVCPISASCKAKTAGIQETIPAKRISETVRLTTKILILKRKNRVMIERRDEKLFDGLWLFPSAAETEAINAEFESVITSLRERTHFYTKYANRLQPTVVAFPSDIRAGGNHNSIGTRAAAETRWVAISALDRYPMPSVYRKIAQDLQAWNANQG